ncbi:AMP-binding protein [Candidatus Binatia bacterium]|nr:AMP-binding protein [Candidatus Binatia bacterium]
MSRLQTDNLLSAGSLWGLIEARTQATPDALFAVDDQDRELTFREYRDACLKAAAGFAARGVSEGTPVSWMLPTWFESMILVGALARLGAVQNPILPIYRHKEVGFIASQFGTKLLILPPANPKFDYPQMGSDLAADRPGMEVMVCDQILPDGDPATLPPAPAETTPADAPVRWVFYSSGTTSDPKGARHTDLTLDASARGMASCLHLDESDRIALVFPFTHVGGIGWLGSVLASGAAFIVVPAFDAKTTPVVLARHGVTQATAGTAFHQAYLAAQRARVAAGDASPLFPEVRTFPGGGAPKPPQLHTEIRDEMGGVGIVSGYGMTECPIMTMAAVGDSQEALAHTEGKASPPEVSFRLVTLEGKEAAIGEEGEIRVKAPQLCRGYLDESLNEKAFDEKGFFHTGDLGHLDAEGFLTITGRLKDVIIRKGENISAKEIEDLLYEHAAIEDVAVIGIPDPATGERACAVVQTATGESPIGFDTMVEYLKGRGLMLQKIPEQLEVLDVIPRNATGKIDKKGLRETYEDSQRPTR